MLRGVQSQKSGLVPWESFNKAVRNYHASLESVSEEVRQAYYSENKQKVEGGEGITEEAFLTFMEKNEKTPSGNPRHWEKFD